MEGDHTSIVRQPVDVDRLLSLFYLEHGTRLRIWSDGHGRCKHREPGFYILMTLNQRISG